MKLVVDKFHLRGEQVRLSSLLRILSKNSTGFTWCYTGKSIWQFACYLVDFRLV